MTRQAYQLPDAHGTHRSRRHSPLIRLNVAQIPVITLFFVAMAPVGASRDADGRASNRDHCTVGRCEPPPCLAGHDAANPARIRRATRRTTMPPSGGVTRTGGICALSLADAGTLLFEDRKSTRL